MIHWSLQGADFILYERLHWFFLFGAFCWLVWSVRLLASARYRPCKGETPQLGVSILVPSYHEPIEILEANLASMLAHSSARDEVLLLIDERDPNREGLRLRDTRLRSFVVPPGKRAAIRVGIERARCPIFLLTGSDTRLTASTLAEILKPFSDPQVGGVTGQVRVRNCDGVGAWCYRWAITLRNLMLYPGMSRSGVVHVLNGECYAARTDVARSLLDEFTNQTFLGRRFESGDDGWMTTLLLREGYQTVYQSTAVAVTDAPRSFREFARQQLRWNRNSTRRSLHAIRQGWTWRRSPLYPFHLSVTLVKTPLWIGMLGLATWYAIGGGAWTSSTAWLEPAWSEWRWAFLLGGIVTVRAVRGLPYLIQEPRGLLFLPLYAFLCPFVLAPLRFYGMLTARNASWMTRGAPVHRPALGSSLLLFGVAAAVTAILVHAPLAALALVLAEDDYDAY